MKKKKNKKKKKQIAVKRKRTINRIRIRVRRNKPNKQKVGFKPAGREKQMQQLVLAARRGRKKKIPTNGKVMAAKPVPPSVEEALNKLVTLGRRQGYLTYEQINNMLPSDVVSSEKVEAVITAISDRNIEITTSALQRDSGLDEKGLPKKSRGMETTAKEPMDLERSRMDDPVRTYLRQMGQIPLLTRTQEIELAKRIEDREEALKDAVYRTKASRFEVLKIANQILQIAVFLI